MANAAELAASVKAQGERVKALKAEKKVIVHLLASYVWCAALSFVFHAVVPYLIWDVRGVPGAWAERKQDVARKGGSRAFQSILCIAGWFRELHRSVFLYLTLPAAFPRFERRSMFSQTRAWFEG